MANRPSRIVIPVYQPSFDGRYWGRYPNGDKPASDPDIAASAAAAAAAAAGLTTGIRPRGTASAVASAGAGLSTAIRLGAGAQGRVAAGATFEANVINASALTPAAVQAAINTASNGQIVQLPAGNATWTSGVTVTGKYVHIRGAGGGRVEGTSTSSVAVSGSGSKSFTVRAGSTITGFLVGEVVRARHKYNSANWIEGTVSSWNGTTLVMVATSSNGSGTQNRWVFEISPQTNIVHSAGGGVLFTLNEHAAGHVELSEVRLQNGSGSGYGILVNGNGLPVKVHDLRLSGIHQGYRNNTCRGICWRIYADAGFNISANHTNNNNAIQVTGGSSSSWTSANSMGTRDTTGRQNFYIEDSYFCGLVLGCIDFGDNVRGVFRHNVLDCSALTLHGSDTDVWGCRHLEVYDCLLVDDALPEPGLSANLNYWMTWRGGSGVITDNQCDNITSWAWGNKPELTLEVQQIRRNAGPFACWTGGYPVPRQTGQGHNGTSSIVEGVYYWNNSGTFIAQASQYNPDECGNGLSIGTYIQVNRDHFARAPQSGDAIHPWTKYPYPHPLRTN